MLIAVSNTSAANASGVRDCEVDTTIRYPRPSSDPTNSPMTAPITAKVMATFNPTKMWGIAVGNRILMNVCIVLAESERISSMSGAGTAESPVAVATMIGKKQTRNTTAILGNMPNPIQSASSGAIATLGTDWKVSRIG